MNLLLVRTGDKYGPEYVERLASAVRKYSTIKTIDLFTDQPEHTFAGVRTVDVSEYQLPGWWAKMAVFRPKLRSPGDSIYLDLDTLVLGDLSALERVASSVDFSICGSFARQFGRRRWPCAYGSCVMTLRDDWGASIWRPFLRRREGLMQSKFGDQKAIEKLHPNAPLLQDLLPPSFFLNYRELPEHQDVPPAEARLLIFGGPAKPASTTVPWVESRWQGH